MFGIHLNLAYGEHSPIGEELALLKAIKEENTQEALSLIKNPATDPNATDLEGNTSLIIASARGDGTIVQALLGNQRIEIDHVNHNNETALIKSCKFKRYEVSIALINAGARFTTDEEIQTAGSWLTRARNTLSETPLANQKQTEFLLDYIEALCLAGAKDERPENSIGSQQLITQEPKGEGVSDRTGDTAGNGLAKTTKRKQVIYSDSSPTHNNPRSDLPHRSNPLSLRTQSPHNIETESSSKSSSQHALNLEDPSREGIIAAIDSKNTDAAIDLIDNFSFRNADNNDDPHLLFYACKQGAPGEIINCLMAKRSTSTSEKSKENRALFYFACDIGRADIASFLMSFQNPKLSKDELNAALSEASRQGYIGVALMLLNKGAKYPEEEKMLASQLLHKAKEKLPGYAEKASYLEGKDAYVQPQNALEEDGWIEISPQREIEILKDFSKFQKVKKQFLSTQINGMLKDLRSLIERSSLCIQALKNLKVVESSSSHSSSDEDVPLLPEQDRSLLSGGSGSGGLLDKFIQAHQVAVL